MSGPALLLVAGRAPLLSFIADVKVDKKSLDMSRFMSAGHNCCMRATWLGCGAEEWASEADTLVWGPPSWWPSCPEVDIAAGLLWQKHWNRLWLWHSVLSLPKKP